MCCTRNDTLPSGRRDESRRVVPMRGSIHLLLHPDWLWWKHYEHYLNELNPGPVCSSFREPKEWKQRRFLFSSNTRIPLAVNMFPSANSITRECDQRILISFSFMQSSCLVSFRDQAKCVLFSGGSAFSLCVCESDVFWGGRFWRSMHHPKPGQLSSDSCFHCLPLYLQTTASAFLSIKFGWKKNRLLNLLHVNRITLLTATSVVFTFCLIECQFPVILSDIFIAIVCFAFWTSYWSDFLLPLLEFSFHVLLTASQHPLSHACIEYRTWVVRKKCLHLHGSPSEKSRELLPFDTFILCFHFSVQAIIRVLILAQGWTSLITHIEVKLDAHFFKMEFLVEYVLLIYTEAYTWTERDINDRIQLSCVVCLDLHLLLSRSH